MAQMGHTDAKMTLGVYARAVASKSRRPQAQRALTGTSGDLSTPDASPVAPDREPETAQEQGFR